MNDHRARYKNTGLDAKELRRRREEDSVQLRKQKRDDVLSKKRTMEPVDLNSTNGDINDEEKIDLRSTDTFIDDSLKITPDTVAGLMQDNDPQLILDNARIVRRVLSKDPQPPFNDVIQLGLIPRFIQLLDKDDNRNIQFEVAWILTNICSGTSEQTRCVVEHGAVPKLVRMLTTNDMRVSEQAVWALGNIIGDGTDLRDLVIIHGFVPLLLNFINPNVDIGFLRNATWVIVNLCRNKDPSPNVAVIKQLLPALCFLIDSTDNMILVDCTWAISYITELGNEYSQLIIKSGILKKLTPLINHEENKIQTAAIRALGCLSTGDDDQTQVVLDSGAVPELLKLLKQGRDNLVKEALWLLSNITAGPVHHIQTIIDHGLLPHVIHYLSVGDYLQQKEATWIVFNYCLSAKADQLELIIKEEVVPPLCNLLSLRDMGLVKNVMESLGCLLKHCTEGKVRDMIEASGGLDKIESLQNSSNQEVYKMANHIIDQYFYRKCDGLI